MTLAPIVTLAAFVHPTDGSTKSGRRVEAGLDNVRSEVQINHRRPSTRGADGRENQ
jgi:hypothetical protein